MSKIIETKIDRWDGGIVSDIRDPRENVCQMIANFNVSTNPRKMTPYRSSESGDDTASTRIKRNFCLGLRTGTTYSLYALGEVSGSSDKAEIHYKNLTINAANDLDDDAWATTANNASSTLAGTAYNLFVYYRKTGLIYGAHAGTHIFEYDPSGTLAFNETARAITYTNVAQGLVHSADDILYIPHDNKIATNDNGAWNDEALVLSPNQRITAISEYGIYLAIAVVDLAGNGNSRVLLWSRQPGTSFLTDSVDFGEGRLQIIEQVEGVLIGVSIKESISGNNSINQEKFIFRVYANGQVIKIGELLGDVDFQLINNRQKINDRLYFAATFTVNGTVYSGIWSIGKSTEGYSVICERTHNNDTSGFGVSQYAFIIVGDYMFMSYNAGSAFEMTKTDNAANYNHNSIYDTKTFDAGDSSLKKDLKGITINTEFLPASSSVKVAYKKDNETQYTTILTHSTTGAISKSATAIHNLTAGGDAATFTIANPCVVGLTAHGLVSGQKVRFTTTGALPAAITAGNTYYVLSAGLADDTFRISSTDGGTAVDTTGNTQSGVHTMDRAFPLPQGYKEIKFRIISRGGAEITGLSFREEVRNNKPY